MMFEIEAEADPIAGRVRVAGEAPRDFTGWVELTRLVEDALDAYRRRRPPA